MDNASPLETTLLEKGFFATYIWYMIRFQFPSLKEVSLSSIS